MTTLSYDLLIIGGGINGTAIAREAALNGLKTLLVERDDLASHTSSASTGLIHGGLRYLEQYEFKLVREALKERTLLMKAAPHIIRPMEFVLPQTRSSRPWLMVRAGLLLYDLLAGISPLPWARRLKASDTAFQAPLKAKGSGFVYADCRVDDARLTVLNAVDAARNGAEVRTRCALLSARRSDGVWRAELSDGTIVEAKSIANAAGPWVIDALGKTGINGKNGVRLVKGSHIVVPRLYEGDHAYFLQLEDGRICFVAPWHGGTTMIGTTDVAVDDPAAAKIDDSEIRYLCAAANGYFTKQIAPADVIHTWSGIRPLYNDGASEAQEITRDYVLELDESGPPLLSVFGGKITTARHLAEEAVAKIGGALDLAVEPKTRERALPGGALIPIPSSSPPLEALAQEIAWESPQVGIDRARRWVAAYGFLTDEMTSQLESDGSLSLGEEFGAGLCALEVDWLIENEWARTAEDVLWRRTKLGMQFDAAQTARLAAYMEGKTCS